jgi:hypothetical protein
LKRWQEIAKLLPIIAELTVGTDYIKILPNYTLLSIDKNDKIELENLLISTLNQQTGAEIMGSLAQRWKEEGIQDGIQIGKAEGEEQKH